MKFFQTFEIESPKTKLLAGALTPMLRMKKYSKKYDLLLIPDAENKTLFRAAANLPKTAVLRPESLNAHEILNYKNIFIEQKAISAIGARSTSR